MTNTANPSDIPGVKGDLTFERFVSVKEAAKISGIPYRQILNAINQGKIPLKILCAKRGKILISISQSNLKLRVINRNEKKASIRGHICPVYIGIPCPTERAGGFRCDGSTIPKDIGKNGALRGREKEAAFIKGSR